MRPLTIQRSMDRVVPCKDYLKVVYRIYTVESTTEGISSTVKSSSQRNYQRLSNLLGYYVLT